MNQKKAESLKAKLCKKFREFLLSSTSHGFPNILRSKNHFIRIAWIIFCLVSTALCSYMISKNVVKYLKNEVITKTRIVNQYSALFPTITICNMNFFSTDFSINYSVILKNKKITTSPFSSLYEYYYRNEALSSDENSKYLFSDSIDKLIVECYMEFWPCNRSEFRLFWHSNHGNCYQFNSGFDANGYKLDLKYSNSKDRVGGLRLALNLSVPESLKFFNPNSGGLVFIHNHTDYPMMLDPVTFAPGIETNIALSRTFYEIMEKPYSECEKNAFYPHDFKPMSFLKENQNTYSYSHIYCIYLCFQFFFINNCGCQDTFFPKIGNHSICSNQTQFDCLDEFFIDPRNSEICYERCPVECDGMWFDKTVSTNYFSTSIYQKLFQRYNSDKKVYLNLSASFDEIAIVNIYYPSFKYTKISEYPTIELVDLLSSIGGIGGLFLGISVLTLVEFFELIVLIIFEIKNHNKIASEIQKTYFNK